MSKNQKLFHKNFWSGKKTSNNPRVLKSNLILLEESINFSEIADMIAGD